MTNDELHWLAFRYVAGEMTAAEEESFEQQLADDQEAREAVAQVVELNEAIRLAATKPVVAPRRRFPLLTLHPVAWAAGLAASLLVVFGLYWLISINSRPSNTNGNGDGKIVQNDSRSGAEVVRAWVEVR